jgi:hypothetical protein
MQGSLIIKKLNGIYRWAQFNRWVPLVKWTGLLGAFRGLFADLRIMRLFETNIGTRIRARVGTGGTGAVYSQVISLAHDMDQVATNAVLVQSGEDVFELWAYIPYGNVYVDGVAGATVGAVTITPYGYIDSLTQDSPPSAGGPGYVYLEWATALPNQLFPGPGYIVAASRGPTSGYIRYDNGVQVCWATITVGSGSWTFPAAFASTPQVQATAQDSAPRLATITSVSTTAAGVLRTDLSGATQSGIVHLYAIGLWK